MGFESLLDFRRIYRNASSVTTQTTRKAPPAAIPAMAGTDREEREEEAAEVLEDGCETVAEGRWVDTGVGAPEAVMMGPTAAVAWPSDVG